MFIVSHGMMDLLSPHFIGIHPPQLQYPVHQPFVAAVPPAVHLSLGSAQAQGSYMSIIAE